MGVEIEVVWMSNYHTSRLTTENYPGRNFAPEGFKT